MLSHCADTRQGVPPTPGRCWCSTVMESQNLLSWKGPFSTMESDSFWTRSINTGENKDIPAVGQVCFRGGLLSLLGARVGPPGRDNGPDQEKVQSAKPH